MNRVPGKDRMVPETVEPIHRAASAGCQPDSSARRSRRNLWLSATE